MGKVTGFMEFDREATPYRQVDERVHDWKEVMEQMEEPQLKVQGARCMDCGIPFCHTGCPINNIIPDWNDLVYRGRWSEALRVLHATNNFPEFTGRICPAPCEAACVLGINDDPVSIKSIEKAIADRGWQEGWIKPEIPTSRTGKSVAVVGSGPAGLAAAQQLNRAGHTVTVYEKNEVPGGLLVLGIPDFKMEKELVARRVEQMQAEGIEFRCGVNVGVSVEGPELLAEYDAVLLCIGSEHPRDLPIPGRDLTGVHFAMNFLPQQNRRVAGRAVDPSYNLSAAGKNVVIIGGGTGADCLGTSRRQGAINIHQFELLPKPPGSRDEPGAMPWPNWPFTFKVESSHAEGDVRDYAVNTKEFISDGNGNVKALRGVRLRWQDPDPITGKRPFKFEDVPGSEFEVPADLVLLAMGFLHPVHEGVVEQLGVETDNRGNVQADFNAFRTTVPNVFVAGDARRGQSLVVWAIAEGRKAARAVDIHLTGSSSLPAH